MTIKISTPRDSKKVSHFQDKKKTLKEAKGQVQGKPHLQRNKIRMTPDLSSETTQARR